MIIDTHTHLYNEEFDLDRSEMIKRAESLGVQRFYMPGIDSSAIESMLKAEADFPEKCIAMMGLHPCYVKENYKDELEIVKEWLSKRKFAAIGEIGLDFYWDKTFITEQYEAFNKQIELALEYNLPIVIHTRNAMQETIEVVKKNKSKKLRGIFHCFGGSIESAKQIIDCGFLLGIGGVVTYKTAGLPEVLKQIELKHIVLETDAPYLSPVPFRGKRNESSYLKFIISKLSEVYAVPEKEIIDATTKNALELFAY